jgi:hypothetical protein
MKSEGGGRREEGGGRREEGIRSTFVDPAFAKFYGET